MAATATLLLCLYASFSTIVGSNVYRKDVKIVAQFAAEQLDLRSNSFYHSRLDKIVAASSKYGDDGKDIWTFTLQMGETACTKNEIMRVNLKKCTLKRVQTCNDVVVTVTGNEKSLVGFRCDQFVKRGIVAGGNKHVEVTPEIQDAGEKAVRILNAKSNATYREVAMEIRNPTAQVVQGTMYRMDIALGRSSCRNDEKHQEATFQDCPAKHVHRICHVEVWVRLWMDMKYKLEKYNCSETLSRKKRAVFFGSETIDIGVFRVNKNEATVKKPTGHLLGGDDHDLVHHGIFQEFKQKFGKTYPTKAEELRRFAIFCENMRFVKKLQESEQGTATYGPTQFADLSKEEFQKKHLGLLKPRPDPSMKRAAIPRGTPPTAWDWREHGAVTKVKNQGSCGSCWAFSVTGNIEGQWAINRKKLVSLSEQELVDCDKIDQGCNGGLPTSAYHEIMRLGGLETEKKYPYEGEDEKCHFLPSAVRVYINGSVNISSNEQEMASWLAKNGPISIGINANAMQFYFGGISHPWSIFCNPSSLDHGVLIVGYGVKGTTPYWIVKNSWGPSWGENGYYLVYRGGGVCGLNKMPTSAIVN